jgi:hypothetical protein
MMISILEGAQRVTIEPDGEGVRAWRRLVDFCKQRDLMLPNSRVSLSAGDIGLECKRLSNLIEHIGRDQEIQQWERETLTDLLADRSRKLKRLLRSRF